MSTKVSSRKAVETSTTFLENLFPGGGACDCGAILGRVILLAVATQRCGETGGVSE